MECTNDVTDSLNDVTDVHLTSPVYRAARLNQSDTSSRAIIAAPMSLTTSRPWKNSDLSGDRQKAPWDDTSKPCHETSTVALSAEWLQ